MSLMNASFWYKEPDAVSIPDERRQWLIGAPRLVQAFKTVLGEVVMQKLQYARALPFADEALALGLGDEEAHIRQVLIGSQSGHSLCYGRVIIPDTTYKAHKEAFSNLGRQFIGDSLLHNNQDVVRQGFEFACFDANSDYARAFFAFNPDSPIEESLWVARRSIFLWGDEPLLITEFLLPYLARVPYSR